MPTIAQEQPLLPCVAPALPASAVDAEASEPASGWTPAPSGMPASAVTPESSRAEVAANHVSAVSMAGRPSVTNRVLPRTNVDFVSYSTYDSLDDIPTADRIHIGGDVKRVYTLLVTEWLEYLRHLQIQYPYLFSLAVRTNPLDPHASPEVAE